MIVILFIHRYLGVAVGLVMTLWCLSGFVMMYQAMPEATSEERLQGLAPLALEDCCALEALAIADSDQVSDFRLETMGGRPVLRLRTDGLERAFDVRTGNPLSEIAEADAREIAAGYRAGHGLATEVAGAASVEIDQWTLQLRRLAPHWRVDFAGGASVYVSGRTGEVVQETTARTRTLAWLGAIPHWLYPRLLRQNGPLWSQIVIWASVLGVFLTATGLTVGLTKLRSRPGRWFPYRRVWLWHHAAGVFFGVLTLTWVASGLLTMDPWGVLVSEPAVGRAEVIGTTSWRDARALLSHAPRLAASGELVQLRAATLAGEPAMIAEDRAGGIARLGLDGAPAPLERGALEAALRARGGALAAASVTLQATEDFYYYGHKRDVPLPVFRVDLGDAASSSLYIAPITGEVLTLVDDTARQGRWLETGLHSLDFPGLRRRPVWDVVVIVLLIGVTGVCGTGTWLALQRVRRDLTPGARFSRNPSQTAAE
jgi:hypothetical protein